MGYYSGSANDMNALRTALVAACTAEGWSWNSSTQEISKGTVVVQVQVLSQHLSFVARVSSGSSNASQPVKLGRLSEAAGWALSWPMAYHLFVFAAEVYLVAVYDLDKYLWAAFGETTVDGVPGVGTWLGANAADTVSTGPVPIGITPFGGGGSFMAPALFHANSSSQAASRNCWVHHDFEGYGWFWGVGVSAVPVGIQHAVPLLGLLPNAWNSEAVLLPLRAFVARPSFKVSMVVDCEHARITRIDNYDPGQIITLGSDRWMVLPWYRKNTTVRNGINGSGIDHTGTMGWAIRYEGP
ncbi:MAG: hypothetical protein ACLGID_18465 [Gammaproteobacteria bacterium]